MVIVLSLIGYDPPISTQDLTKPCQILGWFSGVLGRIWSVLNKNWVEKNGVISGVKCEFKVKNVIVKIMHPLSFIDFGWSWVSCKGWICFVGSCADVGHPGLEGYVRFRTVLGRFCRFLGMFWRVLVRFWRALVRFWRVLRRFWRVLGIFSLFFVMFWTFPSRFWRALDMITRYQDRF